MTGPPDLSSLPTPTDQSRHVLSLLEAAIQARETLFESRHITALRLFNGFSEGFPHLVIDIYSRTLVIFNYAENPEDLMPLIQEIQPYLLIRLPWLRAIAVKPRNAMTSAERRGNLLYGDSPDSRLNEDNVWYALDIFTSQDTSFYLDTRNLRRWAKMNLNGKSVLNTFAYTGSLGVAARAGGAHKVVHLDINRKYLNIAKTTCTLNGFSINKNDFLAGDFWVLINRLKRSGSLFDCAFIDPPFFAVTGRGTVDLIKQSRRVINKVRPLISPGGYLVVVNNAIFVSGREFMDTLEDLCSSGYLSIETLIPVPEDITGYPHTRTIEYPLDPAPFNHPTKIAILRVKRKDERIR
jgi:23S rRNA (cytosine1962-C5)-methyltransferase